MSPEDLVGKKHNFDDGSVIEVIQVRDREIDNEPKPVITYLIHQHNCLPRKLLMPYNDFIDRFGHLFE
jgi:hypothetical protein